MPGMRDPRYALLCKHFAKRHNGAWFRSAARMLAREMRADRDRGAL